MKYQISLEHFKNKWTVEDCKRREITQAITVYNAKYEKTKNEHYKERLDYLLKLKKERINYERSKREI